MRWMWAAALRDQFGKRRNEPSNGKYQHLVSELVAGSETLCGRVRAARHGWTLKVRSKQQCPDCLREAVDVGPIDRIDSARDTV